MVAPAAIAFPSLNAADGLSATEIVIVTNQGTADLHISELYLDDDTKPSEGANPKILCDKSVPIDPVTQAY